MEPCVSIIVPVYNAENYIRRCVDSILKQEYTDFELILVDDGSTDTSGSICDWYADQDNRVCVIHKPNTGVSDTRNLAISKAKGTYLQFLDSDDWITPDATRLFVRTAKEHHCDLVISDFYRVSGERVSHKGDIESDNVMTREEFAEHMMENPADFYYGVLWNKFYRRELIEKHQLRMNTSISWCEDFMFNLEYLMHAETFCALQTPIYYYVKRKGSLISQGFNISQTIKMKLMVFEYYNDFYKCVYNEKEYEKKRLHVYRFLIEAAKDGSVPPAIFPTAKKLGKERITANFSAASGDGILMELYRNRKLLERYLEVSAIKHGLTMQESMLLLYIGKSEKTPDRKELADFCGTNVGTVTLVLQRLIRKELLKFSEEKTEKSSKGIERRLELLPAAYKVLADFAAAEQDFDEVRFSGFEKSEQLQYTEFHNRIKENVLRVLGSS